MTQPDDDAQAPSSRYENILRNTLMQRTGKNFQRNLDAAPVPQQEKKIMIRWPTASSTIFSSAGNCL